MLFHISQLNIFNAFSRSNYISHNPFSFRSHDYKQGADGTESCDVVSQAWIWEVLLHLVWVLRLSALSRKKRVMYENYPCSVFALVKWIVFFCWDYVRRRSLFKDGEKVRGRGRVGLKGCSLVTVAFRKNSVLG